MDAEYLRLLGNLCRFGTITQVKSAEGLALAKVKIGERETDFFPVISQSNSFKKHSIPIRVKEQVAVFCPFGEANIGFIIRGIFNKGCKEPGGYSLNREVITYEDGTTIFYDTEVKELNINAVGLVKVICEQAELYAGSTKIVSTTSHKGDVEIDGTLKVKKQIIGEDGIAITGGSSNGGATFECDISTTGNISDSKGDVTNHEHDCTDGAIAQVRT